jgi:hypothetical protein
MGGSLFLVDFSQMLNGGNGSVAALHDRPQPADSVEKVGFSNGLNSGATTTGEPAHHIEWFFGPSVTVAALLLG